MRSFETYLAAGCAIAIVWPALFGVRSRRGLVAAALLVLVVLQWQVEGFRWQLLLLYLVALGMAVGDVVTIERDLPWFRRIGRGVFGLVGLGLVVAPALILPVPVLPVPTGPMAIGTTEVEFIHPERIETLGPNPAGRRRFSARIWYPAEPDSGSRAIPWEPDIDVVAPALAEQVGVPGFFFSQVRYTQSHAYAGAPPADGVFPLLVYSHRLGGFKTNALDQIEAMVSQGYVVVGIDHAFGAVATVVDGETLALDTSAMDDPEASPEERMQATADMLDTFAADIGVVVDGLDAGSDGPWGDLASSVDVRSIGVWGHGMGGGAALQFCLTDERCDAVAGFDPAVVALPNEILATTATRPMLFMRSDPERGTENDAVLRGVVERSRTVTYWVDVLGAQTTDFIATPLVSPVADRLGLRGPIEGRRVILINRRFLTGFFDRFLLETGSAILDTADFAEVDVERIDRQG